MTSCARVLAFVLLVNFSCASHCRSLSFNLDNLDEVPTTNPRQLSSFEPFIEERQKALLAGGQSSQRTSGDVTRSSDISPLSSITHQNNEGSQVTGRAIQHRQSTQRSSTYNNYNPKYNYDTANSVAAHQQNSYYNQQQPYGSQQYYQPAAPYGNTWQPQTSSSHGYALSQYPSPSSQSSSVEYQPSGNNNQYYDQYYQRPTYGYKLLKKLKKRLRGRHPLEQKLDHVHEKLDKLDEFKEEIKAHLHKDKHDHPLTKTLKKDPRKFIVNNDELDKTSQQTIDRQLSDTSENTKEPESDQVSGSRDQRLSGENSAEPADNSERSGAEATKPIESSEALPAIETQDEESQEDGQEAVQSERDLDSETVAEPSEPLAEPVDEPEGRAANSGEQRAADDEGQSRSESRSESREQVGGKDEVENKDEPERREKKIEKIAKPSFLTKVENDVDEHGTKSSADQKSAPKLKFKQKIPPIKPIGSKHNAGDERSKPNSKGKKNDRNPTQVDSESGEASRELSAKPEDDDQDVGRSVIKTHEEKLPTPVTKKPFFESESKVDDLFKDGTASGRVAIDGVDMIGGKKTKDKSSVTLGGKEFEFGKQDDNVDMVKPILENVAKMNKFPLGANINNMF